MVVYKKECGFELFVAIYHLYMFDYTYNMAMSLALSVLLNDVVRRSLWEREEEIYGSNGKIYVEAMERAMACRDTVSLHTDSSSALWVS